MTTKVAQSNKTQALTVVQNNQPNKVSQMANKIFLQIKNIPRVINRNIKATYDFLASHKFAIAVIACAILLAPISIEATLAAIGLGTIKEAYSYYTKTINYQFKLKAKAYIKSLTAFNANFKDGKVITSEPKVHRDGKAFGRAYQSLFNHMASNVQTADQLTNWQNYLKSLNPKLVLDAKTRAIIENDYEIFSKSQPIDEHIDSRIKFIKQYLENNYLYAVKTVARFCLLKNKMSNLETGAKDILQKLPFVEKVLLKTQKDVLKDLNWSYTSQKIKGIVLSPFRAIAKSCKSIARSKPVQLAKKPLKIGLGLTSIVSPVLVPAIIYGLYHRSMLASLQALTYPISLFIRATCWMGNKPSCDLQMAMDKVLTPKT